MEGDLRSLLLEHGALEFGEFVFMNKSRGCFHKCFTAKFSSCPWQWHLGQGHVTVNRGKSHKTLLKLNFNTIQITLTSFCL